MHQTCAMAGPRTRAHRPAARRTSAELLVDWLPRQRWFAGKGHSITAVRLEQVSTLRCEVPVAHLVVGVQLDGESWQTYQVPVSLRADRIADAAAIGRLATGEWVHDALTDPVAMTALLSDSASVPTVDPARTHALDPAAGRHLGPQLQPAVDPTSYRDLPAQPMTVEQSNSSLRLGDVALVKVFRRLTPGVNPDVEVHAALGSVGCPHVGRVLGWVNGGWPEPATDRWVTGHLALVQELLSPAVDGWDLARERVAAGTPFAEDARALGLATGRVHLDLRRALPSATVGGPGPGRSGSSGSGLGELADRLHRRLDEAQATVPELAPCRRPCTVASGPWPSSVGRSRCNGSTATTTSARCCARCDGWKLLDFEGEPGAAMSRQGRARPSPARRRRDAALLRLRGRPGRRGSGPGGGRGVAGRLPAGLPRRLRRVRRGRAPRRTGSSSPPTSSTRPRTRRSTRSATGRTGCTSRWRPSPSSLMATIPTMGRTESSAHRSGSWWVLGPVAHGSGQHGVHLGLARRDLHRRP